MEKGASMEKRETGSVLHSPFSLPFHFSLVHSPLLVAAVISAATWRVQTRPDPVAATPIKHLVVIYDENISFDHYFGTYPVAANVAGEPVFTPVPHTPAINGLQGALLTRNPNLNPDNGTGVSNPFRLDRTQASTADQGHSYTPEQRAYDGGKADLFPKYTGHMGSGGTGAFNTKGLVMGYFDGNTVTALWNYAQHFAMSDNAYGDQYGPSTPGAINLVSGQTNGLSITLGTKRSFALADGQGGLTMIGDVDPGADSCSSRSSQATLGGRNIGDLLSAAGVSWGWFQGGFDLTVTNSNGSTGCKRSTHSDIVGDDEADYVPHHEPFQYYASTANPRHVRPSSMQVVGTAPDGGANHQYDLHDFYAAVRAGNFPAVVFLKAPAYQNAHAGNSDPLDEQQFVVGVINFLQQQQGWASTAVIIAYDDSDGWYDHQMAPVGNASFDSVADQLSAAGICGVRGSTPQHDGIAGKGPVNGRCGPGTRQPFLVISPWARRNYVDHTQVTQASIIRFIEDNWVHGTRLGGGSFDATTGTINGLFDFKTAPKPVPFFLDPARGTVVRTPPPPRM
jgi:phospholipase C